MNKKISLDSKYLVEIRLGENHEKVHAAWQDDTNEGFLICYDINLVFDDQTIFQVKPCEVEIIGRYPGMALSLEKIESVNCQSSFNTLRLPMKVEEVIQNDYLGEGAVNEITLGLVNKSRIIIRHVFPPMTMGVKLEQKNA
ncbi:hypothetical protein CWE13_03050 [Aliidiomarina shirensis]|uniref:Uncharacterized protein n=1 Tax=Aliidiomarina shirensis TaxID=1048642 RepID=A0A432WXX0_9GAMM|nr:hypothetical protein [Aliidiomarina shirensis]RUO38638.1 hypothetical protein CWE13_03050 [Aliidiomarina shirensis]